MSNDTQSTRPDLQWSGQTQSSGASYNPGAPVGEPYHGNSLARFLGGSPAAVFVRLFFVSLIVGALLMWLDIRPYEIFRAIERLAQRLWALGFDAIREIATYVIAGAAIVLPVWLVLRLMNMRGAR